MAGEPPSHVQSKGPTKYLLFTVGAALTVTLGYFFLPRLLVLALTETEYAAGFREGAFVRIEPGQPKADVIRALGAPLSIEASPPTTEWTYADPAHPGFDESGGIKGTFTWFCFGPDGLVSSVWAQTQQSSSSIGFTTSVAASLGKGYLGLAPHDREALMHQSMDDIQARFGPPARRDSDTATEYLIYSRTPNSSHYKVRRIGIDAYGFVVSKKSFVHWD